MKILIAHDESSYSDAAISDLARAGLPEETEAVILFVVEQKTVSQPSSLALFGVSAGPAPALLPDYERHLVEAARRKR